MTAMSVGVDDKNGETTSLSFNLVSNPSSGDSAGRIDALRLL
jgi:hypothetical protein